MSCFKGPTTYSFSNSTRHRASFVTNSTYLSHNSPRERADVVQSKISEHPLGNTANHLRDARSTSCLQTGKRQTWWPTRKVKSTPARSRSAKTTSSSILKAFWYEISFKLLGQIGMWEKQNCKSSTIWTLFSKKKLIQVEKYNNLDHYFATTTLKKKKTLNFL